MTLGAVLAAARRWHCARRGGEAVRVSASSAARAIHSAGEHCRALLSHIQMSTAFRTGAQCISASLPSRLGAARSGETAVPTGPAKSDESQTCVGSKGGNENAGFADLPGDSIVCAGFDGVTLATLTSLFFDGLRSGYVWASRMSFVRIRQCAQVSASSLPLRRPKFKAPSERRLDCTRSNPAAHDPDLPTPGPPFVCGASVRTQAVRAKVPPASVVESCSSTPNGRHGRDVISCFPSGCVGWRSCC